jgi:regulator of replication initiation timing
MKPQWKRQPDDDLLNNWAEGFKIINAFLLGKNYNNEACFITINVANNVHQRMKGN